MPKSEKDLKLESISLKTDAQVIIDGINANDFNWQIDKCIEECIELSNALIHHRKQEVNEEQVCQEIADVLVQVDILSHLFSAPLIQKFVNKKLISINNRTERITKRKDFRPRTGFQPNLEDI